MSKHTWLIDAGHGGVSIDGSYLTKGKQSPHIPPGIYEGQFNRAVANELLNINERRYKIEVINPGPINIKNSKKVAYANAIHKKTKNCIYISIHANAKGRGEAWYNNAYGTGVFYCPGSEDGNSLAKTLLGSMKTFTDLASRRVMSKRFYVLRKTAMPAILLESGFMTNHKEAAYMASSTGVYNIARAIFKTIHFVEMYGL